jgi:hypothetical protein
MSGGLADHQGLLKVVGDRAVDPRKDAAVHGLPRRSSGVGVIGENVVLEVVLAEHDEEHGGPAAIVVGRLLQRHRDEDLDVEDGVRLAVECGVRGLLGGQFLVEGFGGRLGIGDAFGGGGCIVAHGVCRGPGEVFATGEGCARQRGSVTGG